MHIDMNLWITNIGASANKDVFFQWCFCISNSQDLWHLFFSWYLCWYLSAVDISYLIHWSITYEPCHGHPLRPTTGHWLPQLLLESLVLQNGHTPQCFEQWTGWNLLLEENSLTKMMSRNQSDLFFISLVWWSHISDKSSYIHLCPSSCETPWEMGISAKKWLQCGDASGTFEWSVIHWPQHVSGQIMQ